jgi:hypothetical protein
MTRSDLLHLLRTVIVCSAALAVAMLAVGRCR